MFYNRSRLNLLTKIIFSIYLFDVLLFMICSEIMSLNFLMTISSQRDTLRIHIYFYFDLDVNLENC